MCDQLVYFLDTLCQTNNQDIEDMLKLATVLSQNTRDLVKLGLQQTIILVIRIDMSYPTPLIIIINRNDKIRS